MNLIPFAKRSLKIKTIKASAESNISESNETSDESDCCSQLDNEGQVVQMNGRKIVHLGRFLKLKQTAHWENVKLRNGLVIKIHQFRKQVNVILDIESEKNLYRTGNLAEASADILDLASYYADNILYSEASTMELLNYYWEFKKKAESKLIEATGDRDILRKAILVCEDNSSEN